MPRPPRRSALLFAVGLCALALWACRKCPPPPTTTVASGTFSAQVSGGARDATFPLSGASDTSLTVDRAAGVVTVRYRRGSDQVIEKWRITGYAREPH